MSPDATAIATANAAQRDYWNADAGHNWLTHRQRLDRMMRPITERLLARAAPAAGERVLDVGCGTGESSLRLAALVGGGEVLGADISAPLLEAARERAAAVGNLSFLLADAQVHAFRPAAFDLVASRFGVMFFADPVAAFRNLAAALTPGGRFAFVGWGPLADNPWFLIPSRAAAAHLGPPPPQPPDAPGPMAFADAARVEGLLTAAGLAEVEVMAERLLVYGDDSPEETARIACTLGPAARRIAETGAPPEVVARIAADIAEGLRPYAGGAGVRVPATVNFISARRPQA